MKTHELKIINTSLVWIRRGYFDLIANLYQFGKYILTKEMGTSSCLKIASQDISFLCSESRIHLKKFWQPGTISF